MLQHLGLATLSALVGALLGYGLYAAASGLYTAGLFWFDVSGIWARLNLPVEYADTYALLIGMVAGLSVYAWRARG